MDATGIKEEICKLKEKGRTSYENCEKLVMLCKALKYLDPDMYREEYREIEGRTGATASRVAQAARSRSNGAEYKVRVAAVGDSGEWDDVPTLTREMAQEWVSHMENEDGTTGAHWTMKQTEDIREKHGIDCDPLKFWVALNATYSDLCKVFQKHNINNIGAYTDFAVAFWLKDADAVEDKLAAYYCDVVEH